MGGDYDRGVRNTFRAYGSGAGERRLEIVSGKVYSASQSYNLAQPRGGPSHYPPDSGFPSHRGSSSSSSSSYYYAASSFACSSSSAGGWLSSSSDPEAKRRRRLKSYKVYSYEGKVKSSFRKGFRWIKGKCSDLVHGW